MKESVVWIEDKRVYYWNNPNALTTLGTGRLHASPSSEEGLSKQVSEILLVQEALVEISNEPNVNIRVDRAAKYYDSDVRLAGRMALAIISDVGEPALPTLCRLLLANEKHSYRFGELIPAMAKAGGLAVAPDFVEIIEEELAFWRTMSPTLPVGWQSRYSDYDKSEANRLRIRINNLSKVLYSLKTLRYEDSRDIVVTLRDYWAIEPKLAKLDKVIKESDALLDALDRPAR